MLSSEDKSRIAENCSFYNERSYYTAREFLQINKSCDHYKNYVWGHCEKKVLNDIYDKIRLN
ncbi:MAG: hypothetical protein E6929_18065 [Clostridium sp.]|nr:hypothetical protein [Clostridium sp.]